MLLANELLSPLLPQVFRRRFAAGIDVSECEARLVVLSRRARRTAPTRIEWLGAVPLNRAAMAGVQIADRAAVSCAIAALFAEWPRRRAMGSLFCSMAVPGSATLIDSLPLTLPLPHERQATRTAALEAMEPAVYAHAERLVGIERQALAVDWFVEEANRGCGGGPTPSHADRAPRITIAAAARQHLEARVEAAAAAGIVLSAVDGEPSAALRALCHTAECELRDGERYAAVWIGGDGVYGWRIADETVEARMRYPAPGHADLAAALRGMAGGLALDCVVAGGDFELLAGYGMTLADVGDLVGCAALPFECAPFLDPELRDSLGGACRQAYASTFAVAFGLALRGVHE